MSSLLLYGIGVGIGLLVLLVIVSVIHSLLVAQRLHLLSTEVIVHDPETFGRVEVIRCEGCHGKRHVSLYQYGTDAAMKTVYLCYLCVPRLERTIQHTYQVYLSTPSRQSSKEVYARFTTRPQRYER